MIKQLDTKRGDQIIDELRLLCKQRREELNPTKIKILKRKIKNKRDEFYEIIKEAKK